MARTTIPITGNHAEERNRNTYHWTHRSITNRVDTEVALLVTDEFLEDLNNMKQAIDYYSLQSASIETYRHTVWYVYDDPISPYTPCEITLTKNDGVYWLVYLKTTINDQTTISEEIPSFLVRVISHGV